MRKAILAACVPGAVVVAAVATRGRGRAEPRLLTVSAASGFAKVLPPLARRFERKAGVRVELNFGATRKLEAQIENGTPAATDLEGGACCSPG